MQRFDGFYRKVSYITAESKGERSKFDPLPPFCLHMRFRKKFSEFTVEEHFDPEQIEIALNWCAELKHRVLAGTK